MLMTGTGASQAITIGSTVALARIYEPADFGLHAVFLSISSVIAGLATGKFEKAILLPKSEAVVIRLMLIASTLALASCTLVSVGLALSILLGTTPLLPVALVPTAALIPIWILMSAIGAILNVYLNRHKRYNQMAAGRVCKAAGSAAIALGIGTMAYSSYGLIYAEVFGIGTMTVVYAWSARRVHNGGFGNWNVRELIETAKSYNDFPKYSLPGDFVRVATAEVPVLMITSLFGVERLGFYAMTKRLLEAPVSLVSVSVTEVFSQAVTDLINRGKTAAELTRKLLLQLAVGSAVPFVIFMFLAESIFAWAVGEEWRLSGTVAMVLAPLYLVRLIVSPVTYIYIARRRQSEFLVTMLVNLLLAVVAFGIGHIAELSFLTTLMLYAGVNCLLYLYYAYRSHQIASEKLTI